LPFIFDRFRQADSSSTRAHGGLGLGLALARYLVELHGGTVVAHSDGERKGAVFTVTLPIANAASTEPIGMYSGASVIRPSSPPRLDGVRILVVEDDAESVDLVTAILAAAGADVSACRSAAEALANFKRARPDVLVSDIEMPNEDGYSLIRKIREIEERGEATPAVALTAYGAIHDRMQSLAAGYNMHVAKPVDPQELIAVIASVGQRYRGTTTTT
jgi:CheY-like chemotaxis protein